MISSEGAVSDSGLQRSRDALAGGVCAGIAGRLGLDPVVVRIFMVLLCLMTLGMGVVAYAVLWATLPLEPGRPLPLDVEPREVHSESFGPQEAPGDAREASRAARSSASGPADPADPANRRELYAGVAHEPPTPPLAARSAAALVASQLASGGAVSGLREPAAQPPAPGVAGGPGGVASPPSQGVAAPRKRALPPLLRALLVWACFAAVFVAVLRAMGGFVHGASWWRFWPLFLTVSGIAVMAVPGKRGVRMAHAVTGWFLFVGGGAILPMSLGLVSWASLVPWLAKLWPLLLFAIGFLVVGWVRRSWPWALAAGILFAAFCWMGLLSFALPGDVASIVIDLPVGRELVFRHPF